MGHGAWGMGYGVWGMGHGVWGMGYGVGGMGYGVWGMGYGVWGMGDVQWNGERGMGTCTCTLQYATDIRVPVYATCMYMYMGMCVVVFACEERGGHIHT